MKVLNLYSGIGGNRKFWTDVEVTAVEINPEIAKIYQDFFPDDTVVIADAHQYLLEYYKEFDFIWSSPPCPTHSRINFFLNSKGIIRYPDMSLYQEILFLRTFCKGKFCVENVRAYYEPLIQPIEINRHWFWANFNITKIKVREYSIGKMCGKNQTERRKNLEWAKSKSYDYDLINIKLKNKHNCLRNLVNPEIGLHILECARGIIKSQDITQKTIFD